MYTKLLHRYDQELSFLFAIKFSVYVDNDTFCDYFRGIINYYITNPDYRLSSDFVGYLIATRSHKDIVNLIVYILEAYITHNITSGGTTPMELSFV